MLPEEAVTRFEKGLSCAMAAGETEPTAMALATCNAKGGVSNRIVLLKEFSPGGFVFYTNLQSIKGEQLADNPSAALVLHWKSTQQQVRIEGEVEAVKDSEANEYFASRPRGSQLGAWASDQSRPMEGRTQLLKRVAKLEMKYIAGQVPRPPHWSGFRLLPQMVEFWYGKKSRLHDRFRFTLNENGWTRQRLFP